MMTTRKWELIKGSPLACFILAFTLLGFDIWAVCYNIYNASGGYVSNLTELLAYFGEDEIIISIMGIVSFVVFMWLGVNGAKPDDEEESGNGKTSPEEEQEAELDGAAYENSAEEYKFYQLTLEGTTVEFKASSSFEKMKDEEETIFEPGELERFVDATFTKEEDADMITCYLHAPHIENYLNAEEYVKYCLADCSDVKEEDKKLEQTILYGKLYYYYIVQYKNEFGKFQDLCAACDVGDGKIYAVEVDRVEWKPKLTLDEVAEFMDFRTV